MSSAAHHSTIWANLQSLNRKSSNLFTQGKEQQGGGWCKSNVDTQTWPNAPSSPLTLVKIESQQSQRLNLPWRYRQRAFDGYVLPIDADGQRVLTDRGKRSARSCLSPCPVHPYPFSDIQIWQNRFMSFHRIQPLFDPVASGHCPLPVQIFELQQGKRELRLLSERSIINIQVRIYRFRLRTTAAKPCYFTGRLHLLNVHSMQDMPTSKFLQHTRSKLVWVMNDVQTWGNVVAACHLDDCWQSLKNQAAAYQY